MWAKVLYEQKHGAVQMERPWTLLCSRVYPLQRARGKPWEMPTTSSLSWTSCLVMTLRSAMTAGQDTAGKIPRTLQSADT